MCDHTGVLNSDQAHLSHFPFINVYKTPFVGGDLHYHLSQHGVFSEENVSGTIQSNLGYPDSWDLSK